MKRNDRPSPRLMALAAATAALTLLVYGIARPVLAGHDLADPAMKQRIGLMLDALAATEGQRSAIETELAALAPVLQDMNERRERLLEAAHATVQAETVDTAALEQLRLDMVSRIDAQTREVVQRMAAIASVLTSEQRAKLGEIMGAHHGAAGPGHHGGAHQHGGH